MLRRIARGIDERLGAARFAEEALNKAFPTHWAFMLGEIALYSFIVLLATGIFLTFFFEPSLVKEPYDGTYAPLRGVEVSRAFSSVLDISFQVRAGLVMRQMHHWAALVFVAAIVLHLCRVFFTGAYRKPREINWMVGLTLLILGMFNGFTGYSLPDDLLSGTGLRIAHSIAISVPLVGPWTAFLIFGGEFPSEQIIGRLYVAHILLVPALLIALISLHMGILWRQKHTQFPGPGRRETNVVGTKLWPNYAFKSIGLFLAVFAVLSLLGGLVQINPVWLYGPFDPARVTTPAQPDWYLGWVEGALRLFPAWEMHVFGYEIPNPFFPAVLLPLVTFLLLYLWPFVEPFFTRDRDAHHLLDRPRDHPFRTALGAATLTFYLILFAAASNDVVALYSRAPIEVITNVFRILLFALPVLVGWGTHRVMRALGASQAKEFSQMPLEAMKRSHG